MLSAVHHCVEMLCTGCAGRRRQRTMAWKISCTMSSMSAVKSCTNWQIMTSATIGRAVTASKTNGSAAASVPPLQTSGNVCASVKRTLTKMSASIAALRGAACQSGLPPPRACASTEPV